MFINLCKCFDFLAVAGTLHCKDTINVDTLSYHSYLISYPDYWKSKKGRLKFTKPAPSVRETNYYMLGVFHIFVSVHTAFTTRSATMNSKSPFSSVHLPS